MKINNLALLLLCIFIYSCEGNPIDPYKGGIPLHLQAEIEGQKFRAAYSSWEKGDAIGVYMVKEGQPLDASAPRQNVLYKTTGTSSFNPGTAGDDITFPYDASYVDFIGYYPYRKGINEYIYPVDVENQSVQGDIDLMYSDNAKKINSENPNVQMQFTHQLSKIVLNIVQDEPVNLEELSVIITNATTKASFNLATGTLMPASERGNIEIKIDKEGSCEAILIPETDLTGMEIWFNIDCGSEVYVYPLDSSIGINSFEKSTKYTYDVSLISGKIKSITDGNITDWTEGPTESIIAIETKKDPPAIKGTKNGPYTIAESYANQGLTEVWVEGYIRGSFMGNGYVTFTINNSSASLTNLALADKENDTNVYRMLSVQLPSGAIGDALNLKENPNNINVKVKIKGNLAKYIGIPGIIDVQEFDFPDMQ